MSRTHHQNSSIQSTEPDIAPPEKVILIVEDQDDIRQLIKMSLASTQHKIYEVSDCQTALNMARALKPDLMLLDVMLPAGSDTELQGLSCGLSVCRMLKSDPQFAATYIILLTSKGQSADVKAGLAAGANAYMVKPFSPANLIEVVNRQLAAEPSHGQ
jgi:CheY-like chemotaxis protein